MILKIESYYLCIERILNPGISHSKILDGEMFSVPAPTNRRYFFRDSLAISNS